MKRGAGSGNARPIVAGQAISLLGDYIAVLALPLFVLELSGSAFDLGLTAAFETLPTVIFGFAAGVAIDRVSIKRALVIADLGRASAFGLLALAGAVDVPRIWMVFAVAFLVGSLSVLFESGLQAWLPALLPEEALVGVNSRLQFARTAAWTVGPPIAALLVGGPGGFTLAFVVNAGTFLVSAGFVLVLTEIRPRSRSEEPGWWESFKTGLLYLVRQPILRSATAAATVVNLVFFSMEALLVLFARDELGIPTSLIGWFFGGHALLGTTAVLLAPMLARLIGLGRSFVFGLGLLGGGFLALALLAPAVEGLSSVGSTLVAIVPAGIAVAGVSVTNVAFFTLRQQVPPAHLLGRVISASRTLSWVGIPVGASLGGKLGDLFGLGSVYLGASLALLVVAALLLLTPLWRHREVPEEGAPPAPRRV